MLALDFINVGNGDSILIRELENGQQRYALMVDFGHDCLVRDDHPGELDPRSQRIYAGDFLRELGVERLDMALTTHFHRDHIGRAGPGAGRRQGRHVCNNLSAAAQRAGAGAGRGQRTAKRPERAALCAALHEGTTEPFGPH